MSKHNTLSKYTAKREHTQLAKDMKFVQMILTEMNLVELPGFMFEDNAGAMFQAIIKQAREQNMQI